MSSRSIFRHVLEYDEEKRSIVIYRLSADIPMHLYTHFDLDNPRRETSGKFLEDLGFLLIADSPLGDTFDHPRDAK